tara:strand:- start:266 stop:1453 length:1188 start_codon:yes stop_codon:yes gene_type:complete
MLRKFFLVLIFIVFSNPTYAEKFIDLGPSLKLSYKTGNINTNTFNGFASDISFFDKFNNNELIGNAKTLKIESKKNKDGQVIINLFSLNKISAFNDEFEIEIDKISIRDFNSDILKNEFTEDITNYDLLKHKNFSFNIEGMNFKNNEFDLGIKKISLPKIKYGKLSSGEDFAQESSFEIKGISFTANPSNIDLLPLNVILASIGQQSLTIDLNTYSEVFDKGLMLKIISKLGLNIIGGAALNLELDYSVPMETFSYFSNNKSLIDELETQNFESLDNFNNQILMELGKIQLNKVIFQIEDLGVRKPLIIMAASNMGISEGDVINMSNEMIQSVLFPFIPVNAEKFADSISQFVEQGGKLTFSINPQNPLPIISSIGLLVMPDLAIESLGIKLLKE